MNMSKIQIYIENSFTSLPRMKEVVEMGMNIIEGMEERYEVLLKEGRNEDEVFGAVILEFGSTDEIRREPGTPEGQDPPTITSTAGSYPPPIPEELLRGHEAFRGRFTIAIITGVVCCILAIATQQIFEAIFGEDSLAMTIFFLLVTAGASLFVYFGMQKSYWEEQLQQYQPSALVYHHHHASRGQDDTLAGRLGDAIMLIVTTVSLLPGFLFGPWHSGWVVFPVSGILCGAVLTLFGDKVRATLISLFLSFQEK